MSERGGTAIVVVGVGWDDWYKGLQSKCTPPYIDIKGDPHTIRFSEKFTTMKYKSYTHTEDRSTVLWKKKYGTASRETCCLLGVRLETTEKVSWIMSILL
jgi:hypothetical protein